MRHQIGLDVQTGDAVLDLIDSGLGEDAHFRGFWEDFDDDDLEFALNDSQTMAQVMSYVQLPLIEKLKKALEERRAETKKCEGKS